MKLKSIPLLLLLPMLMLVLVACGGGDTAPLPTYTPYPTYTPALPQPLKVTALHQVFSLTVRWQVRLHQKPVRYRMAQKRRATELQLLVLLRI